MVETDSHNLVETAESKDLISASSPSPRPVEDHFGASSSPQPVLAEQNLETLKQASLLEDCQTLIEDSQRFAEEVQGIVVDGATFVEEQLNREKSPEPGGLFLNLLPSVDQVII